MRLPHLLLVGVLLLAVTPTIAFADTGVAIDLGSVDINQKLSRGGTYQLPTMGVRNPGDERSSYVMQMGQFAEQDERHPPEGWFTFSPSQFELEPGQTQAVRVELNIPTGARPDEYRALLEARIGSRGEGASVGAGAAARVTFTIKPSNFLQAWQLKAQNRIGDWSPWSWLVPLALVVGTAGWWSAKRFEFRVARRK